MARAGEAQAETARRGAGALVPSVEKTATRAAISSGVASGLTTRRTGRAGSGWRGAGVGAAHSGMFPCFLAGRVSRLERSRRSARTTSVRVSCGAMTAST